MKKEVKNQFPPGWDEARVRDVIDYYENQTEDEAVAEDEAAFAEEHEANAATTGRQSSTRS